MYIIKRTGNNYIGLNDSGAQVISSTKLSDVYEYIQPLFIDTSNISGDYILFKSGLYEWDNPTYGGPVWQVGTDNMTNNVNALIYIKGETGTKMTLRDADWTQTVDRNFATFKCNSIVEGIDFDFKTKIEHGLFTDYAVNLEIKNCKFQNANRFLVGTGPGAKRAYVHNNWFGPSGTVDNENNGGYDDQCAVSSTVSSIVMNNEFDRTTKNGYGSSITCGSTPRYIVKNNIIMRKPIDIHHGISAEGDLGNFEYIDVSNNFIRNGAIAIGKLEAEDVNVTYDSINICENTLIGGIIKVHGSTSTNWDNNQFKNINISNNRVIGSLEYGIYLSRISGMSRIEGNQITDSNLGNFTGGTYAPITLEHTRNVAINNNDILIQPISGKSNSSLCCIAINGDNAFVTLDNNTFINKKTNTPFIKIWGNNSWVFGSDNKYRNPNSNVTAVYMNGANGNTFDVTGGKTKFS